MLRKYIRVAGASHPALVKRAISPHTIRHTTATHLLRSGVDINTIRVWLGHVSIDTTNIYAEVDLQRKAEVLAHSNALRTAAYKNKHWRDELYLQMIEFVLSASPETIRGEPPEF
jgi:integrase/recombinase XerD